MRGRGALSLRRLVGMVGFGALSLSAPAAMARDYGKAGPTWRIAEPDLLEVIRARLLRAQSSGEWARINHKFATLAEQQVSRPKPVAGIGHARESRQWDYDPTITIADDIRDTRGRLIAAKGQRFNPLDHLPLSHELAFIDGDSEAQLRWAMDLGGGGNSGGASGRDGEDQKRGARSSSGLRKSSDRIWIVMVKGSPMERMKALKRRFYFDQAGELTARFGIEHVPALVRQKGRVLTITETALPEEGKP
ncbi:MAG: hypothetical protein ABT10_24535 [Novosphingobium sp. SCN 63-17]|nr:MAG: hypothetical protein ABT10_24535 [Novosphingobium sp. SCN 63-17]OJX88275.1 MAG: hypothetical protein BGP00_07765 [Novosphingobium sp. 63-713]